MFKLKLSFSFADLYTRDGLRRLDKTFLSFLLREDEPLHRMLLEARAAPHRLQGKHLSAFILDLSLHVQAFIASLFNIEKEVKAHAETLNGLYPLALCRKQFLQRRVAPKARTVDLKMLKRPPIEEILGEAWYDLQFAEKVLEALEDQDAYEDFLKGAESYALWALYSEEGQRIHRGSALFSLPKKRDIQALFESERENGSFQAKAHRLREREGFAHTDKDLSLEKAYQEAHYCIQCHAQEKDSCSKGFKEKDGEAYQINSQGVSLNGCPLDQKISEMNTLYGEGDFLAAFAVVTLDNPMVAATGYRICNDCMKACIYQKQDPVNIPMVETRLLEDVLNLPWGFEIYSLLTRWNPLNIERPYPKEASGRTVLVVGLGPAGFTLAHHLLNDGHGIVAIDGLKIEPLGIAFEPIRNVSSLYEPLDQRVMAGFGGVAEYGITARWNKNYLKLIRLLLERRASFRLFGGVRFGGTLTKDQAFDLGFDHIALCLGAGRPHLIPLRNNLAKGVRMASDFLMTLQLTGAARQDLLASLQVRLPITVIGGGLTAVDAATEALAYYPVQVEKLLKLYEEEGGEALEAAWNEEDRIILHELLNHARDLREARTRGHSIRDLLRKWGGAKILYRRKMTESPAYRLNHEELEKALEEGVIFEEDVTVSEVILDAYGVARGLRTLKGDIPARTVLIAAGTEPNLALVREHPQDFEIDESSFKLLEGQKLPFLTELREDGKGVSIWGDLHPAHAGNVVKAMGSARRGYPLVTELLSAVKKPCHEGLEAFFAPFEEGLQATVVKVERLTPSIVEILVKAPFAARHFQPGQFYRLQNYEAFASSFNGYKGVMEGLALTGVRVWKDKGLLSLIALEAGASSVLCQTLKEGEPVVVMGPTGTPTDIPKGEKVLLVGGGLGNAVLFSIAAAMKEQGNEVTYFAAYRSPEDVFYKDRIEASCNHVVWCFEEKDSFLSLRPQDRLAQGNIVEALEAMAQTSTLDFKAFDRMIVIGSNQMMAAVAQARRTTLKPFFSDTLKEIVSINAPMQCMMKEICAQCLQRQVDPKTGQERFVFSCAHQDQPMDAVDFPFLEGRLKQNTVQEVLTARLLKASVK